MTLDSVAAAIKGANTHKSVGQLFGFVKKDSVDVIMLGMDPDSTTKGRGAEQVRVYKSQDFVGTNFMNQIRSALAKGLETFIDNCAKFVSLFAPVNLPGMGEFFAIIKKLKKLGHRTEESLTEFIDRLLEEQSRETLLNLATGFNLAAKGTSQVANN